MSTDIVTRKSRRLQRRRKHASTRSHPDPIARPAVSGFQEIAGSLEEVSWLDANELGALSAAEPCPGCGGPLIHPHPACWFLPSGRRITYVVCCRCLEVFAHNPPGSLARQAIIARVEALLIDRQSGAILGREWKP